MAKIELQLPTIQNWSCHSCSGCCRQHLIAITDEERDRIIAQNWTPEDGVPEGQNVVESNSGSKTRPWRLAHQQDGACVFLQDDGLCRIHAKFGEDAKPLACRIYPYAFHPAGKKIAVGLRFSCPSVVANLGRPVREQARELHKIAEWVVPDEYREAAAPKVKPGETLDWKDILTIVSVLDNSLAVDEVPFTLRLLRTLAWVDLLDQSTFAKVRGARLNEFLTLIREAANLEYEELPTDVSEPTRIGRVMFRLLLSVYGRKETLRELDSPFRSRWLSLKSTLRFAWGGGATPQLHDDLPAIPFQNIEVIGGPLPDGTDELFARYFRMKIQGMHFCGAAFYDYPLTQGFYNLALMYPVILWLARWIAAGQQRRQLTLDDVQLAMTVADHHHGYSPVLGLKPFRKRIEYLHTLRDIPKLILKYAG